MSVNHGNTPAAWTGVGVSMIGFVLGGIVLMMTPVPMAWFWVSAVITLAGLPVFLVMSKMGLNDTQH